MNRDTKSSSGQDRQLSVAHIKVMTSKFDIETVFILNISNQLLSSLGSIGECTNLIFLDMTQNKIDNLNSLSKLTKLQVLKLGKNFLTSIDPLKSNTKMLHIDLHGNKITGIKSLNCCKDMKLLSSIYLQQMDGQLKNPICQEDNYRTKVLDALPQLKRLDGVGRTKKLTFDSDPKPPRKIEFKLDPSNIVWYTKEYPKLDSLSSQKAPVDDQSIKKSIDSCKDIVKDIEKQLAKLGVK